MNEYDFRHFQFVRQSGLRAADFRSNRPSLAARVRALAGKIAALVAAKLCPGSRVAPRDFH